jgi:hypothetical protein
MLSAAPPALDRLLSNQARRESNARTYPRNLPLALVRGDGVRLIAADGRRYLDCLAGAGTLTLGPQPSGRAGGDPVGARQRSAAARWTSRPLL